MPALRRVAEASLLRKGFRRDNRDHRLFHFYLRGQKTSIFTFTSHGAREISDDLLLLMKRELKLDTLKHVRDLLNCPMDESAFVEVLRAKGELP